MINQDKILEAATLINDDDIETQKVFSLLNFNSNLVFYSLNDYK